MSSLVSNFQQDIVQASKSVTQNLRTAKLISAKLGLPDIEAWIEHELNGYPDDEKVPDYRIGGVILQAFNPYRGWITVTGGGAPTSFVYPITALEDFSSEKTVYLKPSKQLPISADGFIGDSAATDFVQRFAVSGTTFKTMVEAVRNRLLDWSLELGKRGITGQDMSFDAAEKKAAHSQVFNIQHFTGVLGNVSHSTVNIYDYSSIHQELKRRNVPQHERNELENILDELKGSPPERKASLLEKGKAWIVTNQEFLGAGANVIRQALGIPDVG